MKTRVAFGVLVSSLGLSLLAAPAGATIIQSASGLSPANVQVSFKAELTIAGDNLTIVLKNESPVASLNPADVIGSYYFDIKNGSNVRPTLTYVSATGDVYLASKNAADALQTAGANLKAVNPGDNTWQFKTMNSSMTPFAGFGIGTVGNSNLNPNNFSGNVVGAIDYTICRGDVTTNNLDNKLLVKNSATFNFTGVSGFTEQDISSVFAFGLGTAPDSLLTPEPSTLLLLVGSAASVLHRRRRRVA